MLLQELLKVEQQLLSEVVIQLHSLNKQEEQNQLAISVQAVVPL